MSINKSRIDVSVRLRRAIHANDLALVKRILKNNASSIRNPDFADKSNSSLHVAAKLGHADILVWLIEAGHEDDGISLNIDFETPLMVACEAKQIEVGQLLIAEFPHCIGWTNRNGMDALMLSSRNGSLPLLSLLLTNSPPASTSAQDKDGNTALHYASASGELKALRLLLQYGASPLAQNSYSWTPIAYSATLAAEAYFKQLVAEIDRRRIEAATVAKMERDMMRPLAGGTNNSSSGSSGAAGGVATVGGIRLVGSTNPADDAAMMMLAQGQGVGGGGSNGSPFAAAAAAQQARAGMRTPTLDGNRTGSAAGFRGRLESFGERAVEWSPASGMGNSYQIGPMTPTEMRGFDFNVPASRRRAESND